MVYFDLAIKNLDHHVVRVHTKPRISYHQAL